MESIMVSNPERLRLDKYISETCCEITRTFAQELCKEGLVLVDGKPQDKKYVPKDGEILEIDIPEPEVVDIVAEDIPLDIVYEDSDVILVNKP